jgi:hypothetical protein
VTLGSGPWLAPSRPRNGSTERRQSGRSALAAPARALLHDARIRDAYPGGEHAA